MHHRGYLVGEYVLAAPLNSKRRLLHPSLPVDVRLRKHSSWLRSLSSHEIMW